MIKKFKYKILAGFFLLVILLIVAGAVSIYEFFKLSRSVDALIEDNYKTIEISKQMLEALEREDSGILLLVLGQWEDGRNILRSADNTFLNGLEIARNNITEPNEDELINKVEILYLQFKEIWEKPIVDTSKEGDIKWYQETIHEKFLETKKAVNDLMTMNQDSMYGEASSLRDKSHRAIMPDIVAIIAALVFSILLNFFISKYYISPLERLTDSIHDYRPGSGSFKATIEADREITKLEKEISQLIERMFRNH
jgi:methyl-accepting chemotaxis protein